MQYNPDFVAYRPIFSEHDLDRLRILGKRYSLSRFKNDFRNYEEMMVDFVHTSAKIEGNTYDRLDTDKLLRLGITAGGKRYSDAVMLINLRNAFEMVMETTPETALDLDWLARLHKVIMRDLLPESEQGLGRRHAVQIAGSDYRPLADPQRLRTEVLFVLEEATKYADPFEQAVYLHCSLAYLKYFSDGNRRTSRLMQTAALVKGGAFPLFFSDTLIDRYQRAVLHYCETGDYAPYADFYLENCELVVNNLTAHLHSVVMSPEMTGRIDRLAQLREMGSIGNTFWKYAKEALKEADGMPFDWNEVERKTMIECIKENGECPDEVADFLCRYSPGATTPQMQALLRDDIRMAASWLKKQDDSSSPESVSERHALSVIEDSVLKLSPEENQNVTITDMAESAHMEPPVRYCATGGEKVRQLIAELVARSESG